MKQTAIGIRLPQSVLKQIEKLSRREMEDRSTIIRKLVLIGYVNFMKERTADEYRKSHLTMSEAAHQAGLTLWEMERFLVEQGFTSSYSLDDLMKEIRSLER